MLRHCQRFLHTSLQPFALAALLWISVGSALAAPTETVLYHFQNGLDGAQPSAGLIADRYGSTGGNCFAGCSTVFRLPPPLSRHGHWTETTLHGFTDSPDGAYPVANLLLTKTGVLYGTTQSGGDSLEDGVVFQIVP